MATVRFVPNPAQMRAVPLAHATRLVRDTTRDVERFAKRLAPFNRSPRRRPGPHLKDSIFSSVRIINATRVEGRVGSELSHALVAHEGAAPHIIRPRRATSLRFFWERIGQRVSLPYVSHPGMEGQPYLTAPLVALAEPRGFRVYLIQTP